MYLTTFLFFFLFFYYLYKYRDTNICYDFMIEYWTPTYKMYVIPNTWNAVHFTLKIWSWLADFSLNFFLIGGILQSKAWSMVEILILHVWGQVEGKENSNFTIILPPNYTCMAPKLLGLRMVPTSIANLPFRMCHSLNWRIRGIYKLKKKKEKKKIKIKIKQNSGLVNCNL